MTTTTDSKALATTSTVDALIGGYRAHVLGRVLPTPASVQFNLYGQEVAVQPDGGLDTVLHLGHLLVWAYTLTDITARWWRTAGDRLHVSVRGRTAGGVRLSVFGGCEFSECLGLVALELEQQEGVTVDELYTFLGLLREAQQHQGVA